MKLIKIKEGAIEIYAPDPKKYKLSAKMPVFYNPVMVTNRDINILLLKALKRKFWCMDLLAGTGVRGLRIKKEVKGVEVDLNDKNPIAYKLIKKNAKHNKLKVKVTNLNAEFRLANYKQVYNFIDVDPFGTPVPYLDPVVKALKWRGGILGVTATDTAALCGTYPKACMRKYSAKPLRNYLMHEIGLRILIKKIQEVGAQYEIALTPIFSHSTRHYMRVYFKTDLGAKKTDAILKQHGLYESAGPLWLGKLWDEKLVKEMLKVLPKTAVNLETRKLVHRIAEESKIQTIGFYDIHALAKEYKLKQVPKFELILKQLKKKGYKATRTHFSLKGIRSDANIKIIKSLLKKK